MINKNSNDKGKNLWLTIVLACLLVCLGGFFIYRQIKASYGYGGPMIAVTEIENGKTLDLVWKLTLPDQKKQWNYNYQVVLNDAKDLERIKLEFKLPENMEKGQIYTVDANVTFNSCVNQDDNFAEKEKKIKQIQMPFHLLFDQKGQIHLILDEIDEESIYILENNQDYLDENLYDDTFSSMRLIQNAGLDFDDQVYCQFYVFDEKGQMDSAQTNHMHLLFNTASSLTEWMNSDVSFLIENERHLSNIRFGEVLADDQEKSVIYKQSADIDGQQIKILPMLLENHEFSNENDYKISDLYLESDEKDQPLGLFKVNLGTIKNIIIEDIYVNNQESNLGTGAICGINKGTINGCKVLSGQILGGDYTGGLVGQWQSKEHLSNLENGALVKGKSYIGGIAGISKRNDFKKKNVIEDCVNTGFVHGTGNYIGGIVGYSKNCILKYCESAPKNQAPSVQELSDYLNGNYVGGIVGFGKNCEMIHCQTKEGIVIGNQYVAGIVGYWDCVCENNAHKLDGDGMTNGASVIGNSYVGGITAICGDFDKAISPSKTRDRLHSSCYYVLKNWHNTGAILAKDCYAGGISGYNSGYIVGCSVEMTDINLDEIKTYQMAGDYIGGVTGYNEGTIDLDTQVVSVLIGSDYIGGIVGYNQKDARIIKIMQNNSKISGRYFVGGVCGINLSSEIYREEEIVSSPLLIEAKGITGGVFGADFSQITYIDEMLNMIVANELGEIHCEGAYAGGLIGLEALFKGSTEQEYIESIIKQIRNDINMKPFSEMNTVVDSILSKAEGLASKGMELIVTSDHEKALWNSYGLILLNEISGSTHVSGCIGAYYGNATLRISEIENAANVFASGYVMQDYKKHSFSAGIIGYANENVIVQHCKNMENVHIETSGDYLGQLVEINDGIIFDCEIENINVETKQNLGGMVAVNQASGKISDCLVQGIMTGKSYVGGIAAINMGTVIQSKANLEIQAEGSNIGGICGTSSGSVYKCQFEGKVQSKGDDVGGIIGSQKIKPGSIANVSEKNKLTQCENQGTIEGNGYVGGIAGFVEDNILISYNVNEGEMLANSEYVGGICGYIGQMVVMDYCKNQVSIEAPLVKGVGGIVGFSKGKISHCQIKEHATFIGSETVGGITAINEGEILFSDVNAIEVLLKGGLPESSVGGVAGMNKGLIQASGSSMATDDIHTSDMISVSSNVNGSYIGGVTGYNTGIIHGTTQSQSQTVVYATISTKNHADAYVGGITGYNQGNIVDYMFSGKIKSAGSNRFGTGGITGINAGNINGCCVNDIALSGSTLSATRLKSDQYATILISDEKKSYIGGIAGKNLSTGKITNTQPELCFIKSPSGYMGGIAGINMGVIENCGKDKMNTKAIENPKITLLLGQGFIGGFAGINSENGNIDHCIANEEWQMFFKPEYFEEGRVLFKKSEKGFTVAQGRKGVSNSYYYGKIE